MFLPTLLLLGNYLALAPVPEARLKLPEAEGKTEWHQEKSGRTDLYGDPLPYGAMSRIGTARFLCGDTGRAIAFAPDGRTVAMAGHQGVYLFDAATGKALATFTAPNGGAIDQVAFLPDGKYLVTQSYANRILFWKLTPGSGRPLRGPETDKQTRFALSGNGKLLAYFKDRKIRIWDVQKGQEIAQLPQQESAYRLSLSADGKILASLDGGAVKLWDVASGKPLQQIPPSDEGNDPKPHRIQRKPVITNVVLSPDGKILSGNQRPLAGQSAIHLWETATGKELRVPRALDGAMAFSADGRLLAVANQHLLEVWDTQTGQARCRVPLNAYQCWSVCFSPDARFVATGLNGMMKIWETATGRERFPVPEQRALSFLSLSADGRTVLTARQAKGGEPDITGTVPEEAELRYWDAASGNRLLPPPGQEKHYPPFAALSKDQQTLLTWGTEKTLQVWDVTTGKKQCQIAYERFPGVRVLSDDGKLLVLGSRDPGMRGRDALKAEAHLELWDARTGKRLGEFKGHINFFVNVRFSPDGKVFASLDGTHTLRVWETATQKELCQFKPKKVCFYVAFSPDSRVVALAGDAREVVFLELPSGKELPAMPKTELADKHGGGIDALLFSANGKQMFTAGDRGKVYLWERATGRLVKDWQADPCCVTRMELSADGKVLLTSGGLSALVWDLDAVLK